MGTFLLLALLLGGLPLPAVPAASCPRDEALAGPALRRMIEDDWLQSLGKTPLVDGTRACIDRGQRLAAELARNGVDTRSAVAELSRQADRLRAMPADTSVELRRRLYFDTRWIARRLMFSHPRLNFDRLLFVKRFTQETYPDVCLNHMPWVSRPGGDLCVLAPAGKRSLAAALGDPPADDAVRVRYLLNSALGPGHVHGMDLWFDGDRIVFGYARTRTTEPPAGWLDRRQSYRLRRDEEPTHLYEIGVDGRGLRQLTSGEWSDLDPTYLPDGQVVFVSERCGTSLQCNEYDKDETSCNLYVMRGDGAQIRRMSVNKDGDYLPHCLDNGLVGYTRWEYHERSWAFIQSLWVVRPDGTGADAIFKQHFVNPWALEDVRSIPGSGRLVAIAAGHHTLAVGPLVVIDPTVGINEPRGINIVTPSIRPPEGGMDGRPVPEGGVLDPGGYYSTPWALSDRLFLASYSYGPTTTVPNGYGLYLVDVWGNKELVYRDAAISCFAPIPLRARPRPPILSDVTDPDVDEATCSLSLAALGCEGIEAQRARYLRISEPIGWPYDNHNGGQRYGEDHQFHGPGADWKNLINWTPIRILGDVPLERDGSAHFRVPADTAVYFQLLDENRMELRRMRSFISFQPGERRACVGCHETRAAAPTHTAGPASLALARPSSQPLPAPWGSRPVSFLRDVQPVLDRHCVACHQGLKPAGGLDFFCGLTAHDPHVPGYGYNRAFETMLERDLLSRSKARAQDASITPPLAYGAHRSRLIACLADNTHAKAVSLSNEDRLRLTIWIDANAPYHDRFVNKRAERPAYDLASDQSLARQLEKIHARRCVPCHRPADVSRLDWIDPRNADHSLCLTAPLARSAGGREKCAPATYRDRSDPDYQAVRKLLDAAVRRAWSEPRRDMAPLRP